MPESPKSPSNVDVVWYGERGVVNALVAALRETGVPGVVALLESVAWGGGRAPEWLADVRSATLIVEIGCGQFGDPDLIVVCTTGENRTYATFIEAKVVTYETSAGSNQQGIRAKGYNSTINGQLSLKYRLARALSEWNGRSGTLRESRSLYDAYRRPWSACGLSEVSRRPRYLRKPTVLNVLRESRLAALAIENFHFVALTWDREPFFDQTGFQSSDFRPLLLDDMGNEQWDTERHRVGWIGFRQISETDQLAGVLSGSFRKALSTMVPSVEPPEFTDSDPATYPRVTSYNIHKHSSEQTVKRLRALEALAAEYFGRSAIEQGKGSSSIKYAGKVIGKLVPRDHGHSEFVLLGISSTLRRNDWGGFKWEGPKLIGSASRAQPFFTIDLPNTEECTEIASEVLSEVAESCGLANDAEDAN